MSPQTEIPTQITPQITPSPAPRPPALERKLAWLLRYGTYLATCIILIGFLIALLQPSGNSETAGQMPLVLVGIGLFILLPIIRLGLMMFSFFQERDHRFGWIAALVIGIIFTSFFLGLTKRTASHTIRTKESPGTPLPPAPNPIRSAPL